MPSGEYATGGKDSPRTRSPPGAVLRCPFVHGLIVMLWLLCSVRDRLVGLDLVGPRLRENVTTTMDFAALCSGTDSITLVLKTLNCAFLNGFATSSPQYSPTSRLYINGNDCSMCNAVMFYATVWIGTLFTTFQRPPAITRLLHRGSNQASTLSPRQ